MRYLISFILLFAILENVLSDDSLKKRIIRTLLKIKEIKQRHDMQRKLQSTDQTPESEEPEVVPATIPDLPYNDTGNDNPEDSNPLGNDTIVSPDKPFSTAEKTDNKIAKIQLVVFHGYHVQPSQPSTTEEKVFVIRFNSYILIISIPIPEKVVYRLRIKHNNKLRNLQEEGDESVKTECTISDSDKHMIGKTFPDGVTPDYVCEAKAQKDPSKAQVAVNTDVDMAYSTPEGKLEQLSFDEINFSGNSSEEATNLQQSTDSVPRLAMLRDGEIDDSDKHTLRIIGKPHSDGVFSQNEDVVMNFDNLNRNGNDTLEPYECKINQTTPNFILNCDTSEHSIKTSPHALHLSTGTKDINQNQKKVLQIFMKEMNSTQEVSFYTTSNNRYIKTSSGLSGGAIAGIVIACVVVLVAASIAAIMLRKPSAPIDNSTVVGLKSTDNL